MKDDLNKNKNEDDLKKNDGRQPKNNFFEDDLKKIICS